MPYTRLPTEIGADRTQEVGGSSPPSSIKKGPANGPFGCLSGTIRPRLRRSNDTNLTQRHPIACFWAERRDGEGRQAERDGRVLRLDSDTRVMNVLIIVMPVRRLFSDACVGAR
jgi:hypothetical protein